ncbi:TPA: hypothetical protein LNF46_003454 [Vibrio cholerae]|nr:hypothetical protein DLR65_17500 [Vibrio tarriae]HAS3627357.1 hypothetical protein [Vibrio cholerae]HBK7260974.1 hypothetical protein [Vibrio cholerae]HBK7271849.1 hypothetical protein [Vibrio cholerae]HBK7293997.1 hypothetical protein [Vibrio cholerae]
MNEVDMKKECFDCEFYSFGTIKIFEKRESYYGTWLKRITFLGLLSPVVLGGFVAAFSTESEVLKHILLPLCGLLTISQGILSLFSLVYKWDEKYSYAIGAVRNNTRLATEFGKLKKLSVDKLAEQYPSVRDEYDRQNQSDMAQSISDEEKRFAMRHSLFHFKSECPTCNTTPINLNKTTCDTCGNF